MQDCEWIYDAEVRPGLWRVFNAREVKWFVPSAKTSNGDGLPVSVLGPDMHSVDGLLIPRYRGGMLEDAVLGLAPLKAEELVCLLRGAIEAAGGQLGNVPISRSNLALDDDGTVAVLPGIDIAEGESEARELGELLYAAAQGAEFEETAVPLKNRESGLPADLVELIDLLLLDSDSRNPSRADMLAAVNDHTASDRLPFYPGEPGVPLNDAPTAGLRPITAAAHNQHNPPGAGKAAKSGQALGDSAIATLRGSKANTRERSRGAGAERRGREVDRGKRKSGSRHRDRPMAVFATMTSRQLRVAAVGAAAVVALGTGIVFIVGGSQPETTQPTAVGEHKAEGDEPRSPNAAENAPEEPAAHEENAKKIPKAQADGPCEGFEALTQARAAAFAAGKPSDLTGLTVPGSKAAKADAASAQQPTQPMEVTMNVTECEVEHGSTEAATVRAVVTAEADGSAVPEARIRVSLEKHDGKWKVSRTEEVSDGHD